MRFLIGVILVAAAFLAAWELAFRRIESRSRPFAENFVVRNGIMAEQIRFPNASLRGLLLGSSLSAQIDPQGLPPEVCVVPLIGHGALHGLEVLARSDARPDWVLIESNFLFRPLDAGFLAGEFETVRGLAAPTLHSLRHSARPLSVLLSYLRAAFARLAPGPAEVRSSAAAADAESADAASADERFEAMLAHQRSQYAMALSPQLVENSLGRTSEIIDLLTARGTRVAFFELPTHPDLCELDRIRLFREAIHERFPRIDYLRPVGCEGIRTSDGIHLVGEEASRVSKRLGAAIEAWVSQHAG